jgi:hypothetical protein
MLRKLIRFCSIEENGDLQITKAGMEGEEEVPLRKI